jgi:hypothetical protein
MVRLFVRSSKLLKKLPVLSAYLNWMDVYHEAGGFFGYRELPHPVLGVTGRGDVHVAPAKGPGDQGASLRSEEIGYAGLAAHFPFRPCGTHAIDK